MSIQCALKGSFTWLSFFKFVPESRYAKRVLEIEECRTSNHMFIMRLCESTCDIAPQTRVHNLFSTALNNSYMVNRNSCSSRIGSNAVCMWVDFVYSNHTFYTFRLLLMVTVTFKVMHVPRNRTVRSCACLICSVSRQVAHYQ